MLFNSFRFLLFFSVVFPIYYGLPHRHRWKWLLAASYYFYMCWRIQYTVILVVTTLIDYFSAIGMEEAKTLTQKKLYLVFSLIGNMGILFTFKYLAFATDLLDGLFRHINFFHQLPIYHWLLPVGISFHTFQSISYTIDVYKGVQKAERHFGIFALYVVFFPQLVAGPIERPEHMLPQYHRTVTFKSDRFTSGLRMALWGFFKKMVIADRLAVFVNLVYGDVHRFAGSPSLLATWFFAIQIYCDFSGYTDIALGTAKMMGFDLMTNFKYPYLARSIPEFWHRWHISLTTWFRDYVYIPLGGNRVSRIRWMLNILAVFMLSGLWHGAAWTFIIWGALHGIYYLLSVCKSALYEQYLPKKFFDWGGPGRKMIQMFLTFQLASLGWIFFRSESLSNAVFLLSHLFVKAPVVFSYGVWTPTDFYVAIVLIACLFLVEWALSNDIHKIFQNEVFLPIRWMAYYALIFSILTLGDIGSKQFIYFQF
jgi:D-alanyl-lipoteichoic acid acyltransferase DltB (MBOAT superfamily)